MSGETAAADSRHSVPVSEACTARRRSHEAESAIVPSEIPANGGRNRCARGCRPCPTGPVPVPPKGLRRRPSPVPIQRARTASHQPGGIPGRSLQQIPVRVRGQGRVCAAGPGPPEAHHRHLRWQSAGLLPDVGQLAGRVRRHGGPGGPHQSNQGLEILRHHGANRLANRQPEGQDRVLPAGPHQ